MNRNDVDQWAVTEEACARRKKRKTFKGAMSKLFRYMSRYKMRFVLVFIFAVAGTVFNIVGPKILGKATTELYTGLVAKVNGTGGIDFAKIGIDPSVDTGTVCGKCMLLLHSGMDHDRNFQ